MIQVNIHEAKAQLSELLRKAQNGEQVVICNRNVPVAQLTAVPQRPKKRKIRYGLFKDQIQITDAFFEPLSDEELDLWEGKSDGPSS